MPPRIRFASACASLTVRSRPIASSYTARAVLFPQLQPRGPQNPRRRYADDQKPQSWRGVEQDNPQQDKPEPSTEKAQGVQDELVKEAEKNDRNAGQLPHVSEEAEAMAKIRGKPAPDTQQGTPVQEILKEEKTIPGRRNFSTSTRRRDGNLESVPGDSKALPPSMALDKPFFMQAAEDDLTPPVPQPTGLKFHEPTLPMPRSMHLKNRYDPVVNQVTKLMMKDGKLAQAQQWMTVILNHLRTSPPPKPSPNHPLLPGAPPPSHLPMNPILYLTLAIDSVAPICRIRSLRGAAGGGQALQIPEPLQARQRRRKAISWILDAAGKKTPGNGHFAKRVGQEIVSVVEGKSAVWQRRQVMHKTAVSSRVNLNYKPRKR